MRSSHQNIIGAVGAPSNGAEAVPNVREHAPLGIQRRVLLSPQEGPANEDRGQRGESKREELGDASHFPDNL